MKNLLLFIIITSSTIFAQKGVDIETVKYQRSSLHTIIIEGDHFPFKETILKAHYNAPFPEKYNNHMLEEKSFQHKMYKVSNDDRMARGLKPKKKESESDSLLQRAEEMPIKIEKYFKHKKIANQLVAKWFNRQPDGTFNMDLISERGVYNATEMEESIAKSTVKGQAAITDAGEELINNTFVVVSASYFVENEPIAAAIRAAALIVADELEKNNPMASVLTRTGAEILYESTKDGYSVFTGAHLYQLKWNDSIASIFYKDLWMDNSNVDPEKIIAFDESDLFEMVYVGSQAAKTHIAMWNKNKEKKKRKKPKFQKDYFNKTTVSSEKKEKVDLNKIMTNTKKEYLALATVRNFEKVFVKLQKEYDIFKTKTPLHTGYPITAKIGKKEGLKGGEKFEVFEQIISPKTGLMEYKQVGMIKVDKKQVWDNRFKSEFNSENEYSDINVTTFKGKKNLKAGMLIKQKK
ncbi:MAG: hypothetical protein DRJ07_01465 [Bacteroidetes bacterium]|nr:MAG: hypothetical protein DRJ07_01465 [Bacteroidota bacterium]